MKKLLAVLLPLALIGCTQIDTGNVGVESTMGQFKTEELNPGGCPRKAHPVPPHLDRWVSH